MDASDSDNKRDNSDEVGNTAAVGKIADKMPYRNDPSVISFQFYIGGSYRTLTQEEQTLENFVSQFGSAFSSNDKNAPNYRLSIRDKFFQNGNFRILQDCFVQCANGLVELEINVVTVSHLPSVFPKFAFPNLKKLRCFAWEKLSAPETQEIVNKTAMLLKHIVEGSSSLEELTLNSEIGCAFLELDNILLPSSLTSLVTYAHSMTDLENLAKNPFPELSSLSLTIPKTPVPEDFLWNILSKWRKSLKYVWLNFIRIQDKPLVKICFPVMEKLETLTIYMNGGLGFELNQRDECEMNLDLGLSFPVLKRLTLGLTESRFQQWCEKSVCQSMKELTISLYKKRELKKELDWNRGLENVPVKLHNIQLTSLAFPNLTSLTIHILGTETFVLQYIFKEITQLTQLRLYVHGTESIKTSNFWDALLIGTTPESVEKLKFGLDDQDISIFLENLNMPSVRCLTSLTTLHLCTLGSAEPKNEEWLISEISFTYAFSRMQKLTNLRTLGRFRKPSDRVRIPKDFKWRHNFSSCEILAYSERLLSKCQVFPVPTVLQQADAPRYKFNFLLYSKYSVKAAEGTHNSEILENFVSEFGPAFSSNKKDLRTYSLQITSRSVEFRNFRIFENCFVQCGNGLVELVIQLTTLDNIYPKALPKFDFPNLKKLKFDLLGGSYVGPYQQIFESQIPYIRKLIRNLLEGSSSLEELTLQNSGELDIYGLDNIILPLSLTKLEARVRSIRDLEILAKNRLPKLSYISLNIINLPVPDDFLYNMLSYWSESLITLCLDFSARRYMDPVKLRFPFMEKLDTLSFGSIGINDFELSQGHDGFEFCFPDLKRLTLRLNESAFQQWCVKSVFWFVKTLQINLFGNQQLEHVPVNLQNIQLTSLAFPNLASLTMHIEGNETSVLQHVFKEMIQLTKLNLFVHGTESIKTSKFWDALLIGTTIETIEELVKKLSLEDQQNTSILENTNMSSIKCLTNLTSLSLFKGLGCEPEHGEWLISEISFVNAFFRMPELRSLHFNGRFKISDEMRELLKPKMGPRLEIFNY